MVIIKIKQTPDIFENVPVQRVKVEESIRHKWVKFQVARLHSSELLISRNID